MRYRPPADGRYRPQLRGRPLRESRGGSVQNWYPWLPKEVVNPHYGLVVAPMAHRAMSAKGSIGSPDTPKDAEGVTFRIFPGMIPLPDNCEPRSIRSVSTPVHDGEECGVCLAISSRFASRAPSPRSCRACSGPSAACPRIPGNCDRACSSIDLSRSPGAQPPHSKSCPQVRISL